MPNAQYTPHTADHMPAPQTLEALERLQPKLSTPLAIGPVHVNSRIMLAPMAGVTDLVFRGLVRQYAPQSLICTEMISSNGLVYSKRTDARILDKASSDHPIAYQLAGHKPEVLIEAAQTIIALHNPDTIDINMGCPVKKITGNFEGCSLMKEPDLAYTLISSLVKAINKPVSVKFRLGWDAHTMNYREFGQMCQEAGAAMVVLHARTRAQGYQPGCKWEAYGELKALLDIPVVANGDITSLSDIIHVMDTYGADGVMLGRATMGKPWLIGLLDSALKTGQWPQEPTLAEQLLIAKAHVEGQAAYLGEAHGLKEMRKHLPWYISGFPGASGFRSQLTQVSTVADVNNVFNAILAAIGHRSAA